MDRGFVGILVSPHPQPPAAPVMAGEFLLWVGQPGSLGDIPARAAEQVEALRSLTRVPSYAYIISSY